MIFDEWCLGGNAGAESVRWGRPGSGKAAGGQCIVWQRGRLLNTELRVGLGSATSWRQIFEFENEV